MVGRFQAIWSFVNVLSKKLIATHATACNKTEKLILISGDRIVSWYPICDRMTEDDGSGIASNF